MVLFDHLFIHFSFAYIRFLSFEHGISLVFFLCKHFQAYDTKSTLGYKKIHGTHILLRENSSKEMGNLPPASCILTFNTTIALSVCVARWQL